MLEKALLKMIEELHAKIDSPDAKIDSPDATIATLLDAQTGGAKSKLLRRDLKKRLRKYVI